MPIAQIDEEWGKGRRFPPNAEPLSSALLMLKMEKSNYTPCQPYCARQRPEYVMHTSRWGE